MLRVKLVQAIIKMREQVGRPLSPAGQDYLNDLGEDDLLNLHEYGARTILLMLPIDTIEQLKNNIFHKGENKWN